ncbi:uncharacterized protein LOC119639309 [Glossina fuscipes]|uniref:Uncharacterized protein LOC119639309 n=1 Tax=Glossina fuscipes TaxID=7396 RepID=A0A9C5Z5T2_9MUSC|nr:uncharacterized protein LOC119639309 [Glossina fuscipes]
MNFIFLLTSTIRKETCAYIWGPENLPHLGKYIQKPRNQIKPNDPCSIPGPPGSNYYLQWKHGRVKDYKFTWQWDEEMNCVKKIYYNEDGYYVSHGKKSTKGSPGMHLC